MVRVPGSLEDSGFHRESDTEEDVQVKIEPGEQASSEIGSTTTLLNEARSADRQSPGRSYVDRKTEEDPDPDPDLEEKPRFPPQVPSGTPAGSDASRYLPNEMLKAKPTPFLFTKSESSMFGDDKRFTFKSDPDPAPDPPAAKSARKKKTKAIRKQLKAPESEAEDQVKRTLSSLEFAFHHRMFREFLDLDPVMKILQLKPLRNLKGPVTTMPPKRTDLLLTVQDLRHLLADGGLVTGPFDVDELFDLGLEQIYHSMRYLFEHLNVLTVKYRQIPDPESPRITNAGSRQIPDPTGVRSRQIPDPETSVRPRRISDLRANDGSRQTQDPKFEPQPVEDRQISNSRSAPRTSPVEYHTGSSHYASATSEPDSDGSTRPQRMTLGPSGSAMLQARNKHRGRQRIPDPEKKEPTVSVDPIRSQALPDMSTGKLEEYFQAAMTKFIMEQQVTRPVTEYAQDPHVGSKDVDMESVGSRDHHPSPWEYDPDDLETPTSGRAVVATATAGSGGSSMIQRVRISAISDLKEFSGKDQDEDRARSWISKVKSAFLRDQASESEKCLTFADLLTGPAKNWHRQLSRTIRSKWSDLLHNFQVQYCGLGVSVAWQYYHARKRSEESPLEYLHRLNVAGLRARLKIKDGDPKDRREHVDHFIETLGDQDLADQLTLLRLSDADALEEVLRARDRAKGRQKRSAFGSKYRQKTSAAAPAAPAKRAVRAIQIQDQDLGSDSGSDGSTSEEDLRRIYLAAGEDRSLPTGGEPPAPDPAYPRHRPEGRRQDSKSTDPRSGGRRDGSDRTRCVHCGSRKHSEANCWTLLTCEKCLKRGHPTENCLFVCRGCGELHDMGKCPMEEFYNQIRQWYNPTKHAGLLPAMAEKMLN